MTGWDSGPLMHAATADAASTTTAAAAAETSAMRERLMNEWA